MEVTGQEARFRAMFAEEAEGRLATLSELLLELERNGDDQELLSSVFREAHTLKGAAAVVGLVDVLRVAHAMEEVLEGLRRGDSTATPATVDALLGAVDGMREMVPAVLTGEDRGAQADRLVAALHDPPPDLEPPADPEPMPDPDPPPHPEVVADPDPTPDPVPPPTPAPDPPRRSRRETIRLRVERLDELVRLVGEASAAALRVGRLVTDQLGVEPPASPSCTTLAASWRASRSGPSRPGWCPSAPSPSRCAGPPATWPARSARRSSWSCVARRPSSTGACSSGSPTRCSTWSATPSTTASRHRSAGWPPASPARARSGSTRPSSAPRSW